MVKTKEERRWQATIAGHARLIERLQRKQTLRLVYGADRNNPVAFYYLERFGR